MHVAGDDELRQYCMLHFPVQQRLWDYPGDEPTACQQALGKGAHESFFASTIN